MKTSRNNSNPVIVLFCSMPSCSMLKAYKEKCYKLKQAITESKQVEILTSKNKTLKLNAIGIQSGTFFGLHNIKGKMEKLFLNLNEVQIVNLL